jgi:hypothetical protein
MAEIDADVQFRTVPLTNPLVERHLAMNDTIMLHRQDRRTFRGRGSHYRRYSEDYAHSIWYIRQGKRAVLRAYLTACEIVYINGEPTLYQFRTKEGVLPS